MVQLKIPCLPDYLHGIQYFSLFNHPLTIPHTVYIGICIFLVVMALTLDIKSEFASWDPKVHIGRRLITKLVSSLVGPCMHLIVPISNLLHHNTFAGHACRSLYGIYIFEIEFNIVDIISSWNILFILCLNHFAVSEASISSKPNSLSSTLSHQRIYYLMYVSTISQSLRYRYRIR